MQNQRLVIARVIKPSSSAPPPNVVTLHRCIVIGIALIIATLIMMTLGGCRKAQPTPTASDPPTAVLDQWHAASERLFKGGFAPDGFVVSLAPGGSASNFGDSLIWTGVALASLSCASGAPIEQALINMISTLNGGLWRHPTLPNEISLDGALGFYLGVAHRIRACDGATLWRPLLLLHQGAAELNENVFLEPPFTAARDAVLSLVGLTPYPDNLHLAELGDAAAFLGAAPGVAHKTGIGSDACFRAHLGLLSLEIIEATGGSVPARARDGYCAATAAYDLPTADHYCGRGDLRAWAAGFVYNQWQYRHQRCPAWESPDGLDLNQPAVDLLRGLADAYKLPF